MNTSKLNFVKGMQLFTMNAVLAERFSNPENAVASQNLNALVETANYVVDKMVKDAVSRSGESQLKSANFEYQLVDHKDGEQLVVVVTCELLDACPSSGELKKRQSHDYRSAISEIRDEGTKMIFTVSRPNHKKGDPVILIKAGTPTVEAPVEDAKDEAPVVDPVVEAPKTEAEFIDAALEAAKVKAGKALTKSQIGNVKAKAVQEFRKLNPETVK